MTFRRERVANDVLVLAHLGGDANAMETLYRRHAKEFLGVAARIVGTRAEAADAVHDTFVKVLQKIAGLRDPKGFRAWAMRILVNECRGRLRAKRRFWYVGRGEEETLPVFAQMAARAQDPEASAELSWLAAHVSALPANERIAWSLRYVEGYQVDECAACLGVSIATVKRRTAAALRRLGHAGYRPRRSP